MFRAVSPELLDTLPPTDEGARKSRRDLQRLNSIMGHLSFFLRWLLREQKSFSTLVELGAGDGRFALKLARVLAPHIGPRRIVLVDKAGVVEQEVQKSFQKIGWPAEVIVADVFEWLAQSKPALETAIFANLFLHHFSEGQLRSLFQHAARHSVFFCACEPHRSRWSLAACELLPLLGCSQVTRHDAPISVWAGFRGTELSALWPEKTPWSFWETRRGLFSHGFVARRATN
jgi:hypothetical protein